jgi:hypothetical protein
MEARLHRQAAEMFRLFARFEYALKAAGFHNGHGDAKADWRAFAESVNGLFDSIDDPALGEAVDYIRRHPPRKQVIRNGVLDWGDGAPDTDLEADRILLYVRRVRNNLFHGGKFNGRWLAPQRSEELMRHSMTILHACLEASPAVRKAFEQE